MQILTSSYKHLQLDAITDCIIGIKHTFGKILYTIVDANDTSLITKYGIDNVYDILIGKFKLHFTIDEFDVYQKMFNINMDDFTQYDNILVSNKYYMHRPDYSEFNLDDNGSIKHQLSLTHGTKLTINPYTEQHYNHITMCAYTYPGIRMSDSIFTYNAVIDTLICNNLKTNLETIDAIHGNIIILCNQQCPLCHAKDTILSIIANGLTLTFTCSSCKIHETSMHIPTNVLDILAKQLPPFERLSAGEKYNYVLDMMNDVKPKNAVNVPDGILNSIKIVKSPEPFNYDDIDYIVAKIIWERTHMFVVDINKYILLMDNEYIDMTKSELLGRYDTKFVSIWITDKNIRTVKSSGIYKKYQSDITKSISMWLTSFVISIYDDFIEYKECNYRYTNNDMYVLYKAFCKQYNYITIHKKMFIDELQPIFNTIRGCAYKRMTKGMFYVIEDVNKAHGHLNT